MSVADVDLRKLRYFVAVAEHLHFGRAAEELHIAQPVLSRQIRALEEELKAQLFVRDKRTTGLTPAGRQLLADAGPLLASADALRRRVTRAARGPGSFTIGFMPGLIVTGAVRALAARHPQLTIDVLRTSWDDQTEVLHDGRADVSYIRLPVDQSGLQVQALLAEPRVAVLPAGHRLAGKDTISVADLADEHLLQDPAAARSPARPNRTAPHPPRRGEPAGPGGQRAGAAGRVKGGARWVPLADSHGSVAVGGRELGGEFRDGASGVPATGQCRLRDGGSSFGSCWVSVPDRLRTSLLIVVQASSAAAKDAPAATVMATGKPAAILAGSSKAEPESPAARGRAATAII